MPCQGRAMCQPVVEASKVCEFVSLGGADIDRCEVTSYDNPNTRREDIHQQAQLDLYDDITSVLPTCPERAAQEVHRATRWGETSDFQFECADECKYPITYKIREGKARCAIRPYAYLHPRPNPRT